MDKLADISVFESLNNASCSSYVVFNRGRVADYVLKKIAPYKKDDQTWGEYLRRHYHHPFRRLAGGALGGLWGSTVGGLGGMFLGHAVHGVLTHPSSYFSDWFLGDTVTPEMVADLDVGALRGLIIGALLGAHNFGSEFSLDFRMKPVWDEIQEALDRRERGEQLDPDVERRLGYIDRLIADLKETRRRGDIRRIVEHIWFDDMPYQRLWFDEVPSHSLSANTLSTPLIDE